MLSQNTHNHTHREWGRDSQGCTTLPLHHNCHQALSSSSHLYQGPRSLSPFWPSPSPPPTHRTVLNHIHHGYQQGCCFHITTNQPLAVTTDLWALTTTTDNKMACLDISSTVNTMILFRGKRSSTQTCLGYQVL